MRDKKPKQKPSHGKPSVPRDSASRFERLLRRASTIQHYSLRLYVTGTTPRSTAAVANIRSLCEEYLNGRYDLEVVDIYQQREQAVDHQIIAAPTLIKETPMPPKRLVGNLSDREKVLVGLNIKHDMLGASTKWSEV